MSGHFNGLSPAEAERLALLLEELGEAQQVIGKILRHGYESHHPENPDDSNRALLEGELGDVMAAIEESRTAKRARSYPVQDQHLGAARAWRVITRELQGRLNQLNTILDDASPGDTSVLPPSSPAPHTQP
jgi:hypothetical protein